MKIDRSLTANIEQCPSCQALLKHLTSLGKDLGLKICVEGAETASQVNIICRNCVDTVQGYYFAKPMPPDMILEWIRNYTASLPQDHGDFHMQPLSLSAELKG